MARPSTRTLWLAVVLLTAACRAPGPPVRVDTDSTGELLRRCAGLITARAPFSGERLLAEALSVYRADKSARAERVRLAASLLRIGRAADAAALYDELLAEGPGDLSAEEFLRQVEFPRAVAYLRLGEQENCVRHNGAASCLFPISQAGVHRNREGSARAAEALASILGRHGQDVRAKWLLNLAHMTLGSYPEAVPVPWRIYPDACRSDRDMAPFRNVASRLGVDTDGLSGGAIVEDFTGDDYLDILVSSSFPIDDPAGQLRFFVNNCDGTFTDATRSAGLQGLFGGLNMIQADYDNDGFPDVFIVRGAWREDDGRWPNTLLRNNGDGTFTDVTVEAGVLSFWPTQAAAWGDFDNDGWIDLFVANETGIPAQAKDAVESTFLQVLKLGWRVFKPGVQGHLYRNTGRGTFEDVFAQSRIRHYGWVKGVSWGDFDQDGRIDLYVSRMADRNLLYRNIGPDAAGNWRFEDVTDSAGVGEPLVSFATWFWDYDNDGDLDLFVAGYPYPEVSFPGGGLPMEFEFSSEPEILELLGEAAPGSDGRPRLFRNRGDGTFDDVTLSTGLSVILSPMGANFGDVDNDGFLDMYLGTGTPQFDYLVPNRLFRNRDGAFFEDATFASRLGHLQKGHAIAFGDLDNDGDQDIYTSLGGGFLGDTAPNALFENPGNGNHWITLKLEGTRANRSAVGARLELTVDGASGRRKIHRVVGSGGSFGSSSLQQEIGLADATIVHRLEIQWPDSSRSLETFHGLEPNRAYRIRQGSTEAPSTLRLVRLDLGGPGKVVRKN